MISLKFSDSNFPGHTNETEKHPRRFKLSSVVTLQPVIGWKVTEAAIHANPSNVALFAYNLICITVLLLL